MSQEQIGAARVMPNSPNAEKSVLGAMMISPDAVAAAMEVLTRRISTLKSISGSMKLWSRSRDQPSRSIL